MASIPGGSEPCPVRTGSGKALTTRCYTSCTLSYLAKARVLADSIREFHPDWHVCALICEPVPSWFKLDEEPFDSVLTLEDLEFPALAGWTFSHSIVEVCTGVKGAALHHLLLLPDTDAVVYLDPDVELYEPLDAVQSALDDGSIVLTPHQLKPEVTPRAVIDNEMTSLVHGIYNLGFVAVRPDEQGLGFASWWRERLIDHCFDDRMSGLFTDQRWCDFVPAYFERHVILRHSAYNVGLWNISQRDLTPTGNGKFLVDGEPLAFFHFSGFGSDDGLRMLDMYAARGSAIFDLWERYGSSLAARGQSVLGAYEWVYARFEDGTMIDQHMRDAYRYRPDVRARFPDPFCVDGNGTSFLMWWQEEGLTQWATR